MAAHEYEDACIDSDDSTDSEQVETAATTPEYHAMFHAINEEPSKRDVRRTLKRSMKAILMLFVAALIIIFTVGLTVAPTKSALYLAIMEAETLDVSAIQEILGGMTPLEQVDTSSNEPIDGRKDLLDGQKELLKPFEPVEHVASTERVEAVDPEIGLEVGPFGFVAQMSPLFAAVSRDSASDVVEALLQAGAEPNREGFRVGPFGVLASMSALCIASTGATSTELLLAHGADPRRPCISFGPFGVLGQGTALFAAALKGNVAGIHALISKGAELNGVGFMLGAWPLKVAWTPVHAALEKGHTAAFNALIEAGALH